MPPPPEERPKIVLVGPDQPGTVSRRGHPTLHAPRREASAAAPGRQHSFRWLEWHSRRRCPPPALPSITETVRRPPHQWLPPEVRPLAEREGRQRRQQRRQTRVDATPSSVAPPTETPPAPAGETPHTVTPPTYDAVTHHLDSLFRWATQENAAQRNAYALLEAQVRTLRQQADAHGQFLEQWRRHALAGLPPPPPPNPPGTPP